MKFILVVCAFFLGVGLRSALEISVEVVVWLMVVSFGLAIVWRRSSFASSAPVILITSLCFIAVSLGILRTEISSWQFGVSSLEEQVGQTVEFTGVIVNEPDYRESSVQLHVENEFDKVLVTADRHNKFHYGDEVVVKGKLDRPTTFETDLGRTFDYPKYLQARGIEYRVSFAEVGVIESGLGNPIISTLLKGKQEFILSTQKIISPPAVGLGNGLLLGVKSALGDDIETDFRRTGIIHIVVLSGYNVMLVVAFVMFCFSFFLSLRWRFWAGVTAIVCFALIVGLSATVVRASIMACLVLLAQVLHRKYDVLRALFLAGAVMLLINPYLLLYDIGFQLSFMATLGLLLIVPQFESRVVQGKGLFGLRAFFLATVATQIAVLPLLLYHIGEVSLIAVVVNVLVLPIVPVAMFLTFLTGLVGFLSVSVASAIGFLTAISLNYILFIAAWFGSLPFATVAVPEFSFWAVGVGYLGMVMVYLFIKHMRQEANPYRDWTIESESDTGIEKASSEIEPTKKDDLPIFFR